MTSTITTNAFLDVIVIQVRGRRSPRLGCPPAAARARGLTCTSTPLPWFRRTGFAASAHR